jgi:hypothetical protein
LQLLPTGKRTRRCARLLTQVGEDPLDDRLLKDRGVDLELAAASQAVLEVQSEHVHEQSRRPDA